MSEIIECGCGFKVTSASYVEARKTYKEHTCHVAPVAPTIPVAPYYPQTPPWEWGRVWCGDTRQSDGTEMTYNAEETLDV